jgi:capsule polysaccharide export protein KpsE/RkpR
MKHTTLLLVLIPAAVFLAGCEKPKTATDISKTASQDIAKVQAKTTEAAADMRDYTFAQKAEFTASMQKQIGEINRELDALETKLASSSIAVRAEAKPKIEALRLQAAALTKQLDLVKDSNETTWDSVKAGTKKAYEELKDGFNSAHQWVSEKIAP